MENKIPSEEVLDAYKLVLENKIFSSKVYLRDYKRNLEMGYDTPSLAVAALGELEGIPKVMSSLGFINVKDYEKLRDDLTNLSLVLRNKGNEEASRLSRKISLDYWFEAEKSRNEFFDQPL